ncbi:hypothetical protein [Oceanobacillus polygoni]|uniref:Uncharacterized membrane protein (DUF485 family) n=1 Tax=Oceanobacillus polygoni TaxID=1235259 RepID=A0A9X0YVU3_9BACI|nr:hypothetical protein [Oceanobacillus polygoni]MBP2079387.1 uncharacterized membrane protein (DUF485 family) [Oceanobacillus polygoni]
MKEQEFVMTDEPCETIDIKKLQKLDRETRYIVSSEFRTGLSLTIIYFIFIISVPVMNWYKPDWAFTKLFGGMSASWFLTSIVAMVMAFVIAYVHTRLYERWEKKVKALTPSAGNEEEKETIV